MTLVKNLNGDIVDPGESLLNYFDELLGGEPEKAPVKAAEFLPDFADPSLIQKQKLQKLLHSAQVAIQAVPVEKVIAAEKVTTVEKIVTLEKVAIAEKVALKTSEVIQVAPVEIQEWDIATSPAIVEQAYQVPGLQWLPNGLPSWAQAKFDVLLIKVSGLTLAVPLISLGQIQPITPELTPIFGQADWFIGIQPTLAGSIRVLNTAKFVMPERYDEDFVKNAKLLISIADVPWGLAVDSVNQPIQLEPAAVKWRTDRSKRPWLAGIIKEHMCALLDIPMIGQLLLESDKNSVKNHS